jgi:hypothetical protein
LSKSIYKLNKKIENDSLATINTEL